MHIFDSRHFGRSGICAAITITALSAAAARAQGTKESGEAAGPMVKPPGQRVLTGDDARRAEQLEKAIAADLKADRWDEAIARADNLLALRMTVQGPKDYETVNQEWRLRALRRVAPMPHDDRVAFQSALTMSEEAKSLHSHGKYAQAQQLLEKALEIRRRLLTDNHPDTAGTYNDLAVNVASLNGHLAAEPLAEKALDIQRRLLTDNHPDTAQLPQLGLHTQRAGEIRRSPAAL